MSKNKKLVIVLLVIVALLVVVPLFALQGAEFGGSDDAGSTMIEEIQGGEYEPWFTPVLETLINGELAFWLSLWAGWLNAKSSGKKIQSCNRISGGRETCPFFMI